MYVTRYVPIMPSLLRYRIMHNNHFTHQPTTKQTQDERTTYAGPTNQLNQPPTHPQVRKAKDQFLQMLAENAEISSRTRWREAVVSSLA
jgi:hypothetical protein